MKTRVARAALRFCSRYATSNQPEVGLSLRLQKGVCLLRHLMPVLPTASLAVGLPGGRQHGFSTFPACHTVGLGSASSPAVNR